MAKTVFFEKAVNRLVVPVDREFKAYGKYGGRGSVLYTATSDNEERESIGRSTGRLIVDNDGSKWIEMTLFKASGQTTAWFALRPNGYDTALLYKPASDEGDTPINGNKLVEMLIGNDNQIAEQLYKASAIIEEMPNSRQKEDAIAIVQGLESKLLDRQNKIKESGLVKFTEKVNSGVDWIKDKLGLGAIITGTVAILVGVGVGLAGAAALYFVFKPDYDESQTDLKVSRDLETLLEKAEPETSRKIKEDLEKQVDKAYNQGKTDGTFGGMFSIIKPLALAAGGFWVITQLPGFIERIQTKAKS